MSWTKETSLRSSGRDLPGPEPPGPRRRREAMVSVRRNTKSIALGLLMLLVVQTIGCNTFVPLSENLSAGKDAKIDARLRVHTRDEATYVFPANEYIVRYNADSTIARVRGWGDKYTSFGLVD